MEENVDGVMSRHLNLFNLAPGDTPMSRIFGYMVGACLLVVLMPGAQAQGVVNYPPADGMMYAIPPQYPAPGGFGGQYTQTYPAYPQGYYGANPYVVQQQGVPSTSQVAPRVRGRAARGARSYSRGYSQPPAPYSTPLPQGQIYWPGSFMAPGYTPFSRYQSYGSGYGNGPYGSGFYGGYYKGFPMGY
jgi:hypothetical protein